METIPNHIRILAVVRSKLKLINGRVVELKTSGDVAYVLIASRPPRKRMCNAMCRNGGRDFGPCCRESDKVWATCASVCELPKKWAGVQIAPPRHYE